MKIQNGFRILPLCAFLILPVICFSQARKPPQSSASAKTRPPFLQLAKSFEETQYVTRLVLRNGLTILVEEYKVQPVVSIQTYIRAGSFDESMQSLGVSRLLAAAIERGSSDKMSGTLRQNAHILGGILHRSVDYEYTRFEVIVPSSRWKQALNLQTDAILNASWDQNDLTLEASLLSGESRDALDNPRTFATEKLLELAFNQPRMGKFGEISGGQLQALKRESLIEFRKTMYAPSRITLVISGDVISSEVLNEIVRVYGKSPEIAAKPVPVPARESQNGFRYRLVRGEIPIPNILFGFQAVPENTGDYRALEVLSTILGAGEGSIFSSRLRDQMGLIFSAQSSLLGDKSIGYFLMQMEVDPQNIDRSEIAALTEIELLKRNGVGDADVARAQAQLELEYWKHLETVTGRGDILAHYELLGDWKKPDRYISEINKVEPSDIKRVANKYLRLDRCSLLEYLPPSEEARNTTTDGMRQTFESLLEAATDQEQAKREKETVAFMKIPENSESFKFSEVQYPFEMASILRGPDMYIREDHTAPLIEMGIFFRGGKFEEKKENAGITRLMAQLMMMRTKDMPAFQFRQQLEIYGAQVRPVITDDYFGFIFSVLSRNFADAFNLLQQAIKTPNSDKDDVNRQKEIQLALILKHKYADAYGGDLMNQGLFGDHSYSSRSLGTESSLSGITPNSIVQWHEEYVKNRKPFVVIIGDTKGTSLATHFVQQFSGSRMRETKMPEEWTKPLEKSETKEMSWKKDQSLIFIGFQAPPVDDEDGYAVTVIEHLAGNLGRLSQVIGDQSGASYKISVVYKPRLRGGSLVACAKTNPNNEEKVFNALKEEIQRIAAGPNSYRDFRSAIDAAVGLYKISNQARPDQIEEIIKNMLAGKGIDGFLNFPTDIQKVKEEELSDIAQRILNMEKAVIVRVHGQAK